MPADPESSLQSFLESQDASTLVALLLEFADEHDGVRRRIERLQLAARPAKLAAAFRRTLSAWQRSQRHLDWREAPELAGDFGTWLTQIERELLPRDPAAALELAQAFIESDASFFARTDDSGDEIGSAVAAACRLWLQAAARCEAPADEWPGRIHRLVRDDDYGARGKLLHEAGTLLGADGLRELVGLFGRELEAAALPRTESQPHPPALFAAAGALTILSEALADPDLRVRSVLVYSPRPNALQMQEFAAAYLRHGRPADALTWLEGPAWQDHEGPRQRLLADTLRALDRRDESAAVRRQLFEASLSVADLHEWLDDLVPEMQGEARQLARDLALASGKPVAAALLLLELGEDELAETTLLEGEAGVRKHAYTVLAPLARQLDARERCRGATCVYRALLEDVLARGYAPAYPHGAEYWVRLHAIAERGVELSPLQPHSDYARQVMKQHARKSRFWACVAEAGGVV